MSFRSLLLNIIETSPLKKMVMTIYHIMSCADEGADDTASQVFYVRRIPIEYEKRGPLGAIGELKDSIADIKFDSIQLLLNFISSRLSRTDGNVSVKIMDSPTRAVDKYMDTTNESEKIKSIFDIISVIMSFFVNGSLKIIEKASGTGCFA